MDIIIDVEKMLNLNLTPNEFVVLDLIYKKDFASAKRINRVSKFINKDFIGGLVEKRLIHNMNAPDEIDLTKIVVRGWTQDTLAHTVDYFDELLDAYPNRVVRPDGTADYLKVNVGQTRDAYNKLVKNDPVLHQEILACLKNEVNVRTNTGKLMFMRRLNNWFKNEGWLAWRDIDESSSNLGSKNLGYGLSLV